MIYDENLEKEALHYLEELNKKIKSILYKEKSNTGKDGLVTEMIMLSGYLSNSIKKSKDKLKSDVYQIKQVILRVKEILQESE